MNHKAEAATNLAALAERLRRPKGARVMETKSQKSKQFNRDRNWFTAGRMMDWECPNCGSPGWDVAGRCNAPLEQACPGFLKIEESHRVFERCHASLSQEVKP